MRDRNAWDCEAKRRKEPAPDEVRVPPKRGKHKPYFIEQYCESWWDNRPGHWWKFGRYRTKRDADSAWKRCVHQAKLATETGNVFGREFRRGEEHGRGHD